ncbi:MAG: tryptophan synthase subunit alpha [Ilumatobacteraceae bacterium]|jgi:tryptophan synthase alpha chain
MIPLEVHLRTRRDGGRKILVPYITGGVEHWQDAVRAAVANGADAIEIGIPFSDPVMDGPVIQRASREALLRGATLHLILDGVRSLDVGVPLVVMCYYNTVFRAGHERFARMLTSAGVSGAIVPDLPLEESAEWCVAADAADVATVMLAAPTAPDDRLPRIAARSRGFVYAVGLLGVTGERETLSASATAIAGRVKRVTDLPVLVGVGISDARQAGQACAVADGVIQGASVMRRLLDEGVESVGNYVAQVREAIDE